MKPSQDHRSSALPDAAVADPRRAALQGEARELAERHIRLHQLTSKWLRDLDGPTIGERLAAELRHSSARRARHRLVRVIT